MNSILVIFYNLAQQLQNSLICAWWYFKEYITLELTIPQFRVGNPDRYREELITFRPLLPPEGYERLYHPETHNLSGRFPNLRKLRIEMCGLLEVPPLPKRWLTRLIICDNPITHLPENLPDTITELFIFRNDIRLLPKHLPKNLRKIDVYGNRNLRIEKDYRFPNGLEELICHQCNLLELPDVLPHTLKRLICDTNRLQELPRILPIELKELTCCRNDIARIPKLPDNLIELRCTDNTRIKWLPELPDNIVHICLDRNIYKAYHGLIPYELFQNNYMYIRLLPQTREKMNEINRQMERIADLIPEFKSARDQIMLNPRRITRLISTGEIDITAPGWDI